MKRTVCLFLLALLFAVFKLCSQTAEQSPPLSPALEILGENSVYVSAEPQEEYTLHKFITEIFEKI